MVHYVPQPKVEEILGPIQRSPEEVPEETGTSHLAEKLRFLLDLAEKVEQPTFVISVEEASELILGLGLLLKEASQPTSLGSYPQEVPWKGDELGNVLMIQKKVHRFDDLDILKVLGECLLHAAQGAIQAQHKLDNFLGELSEYDPFLNDWDSVFLEIEDQGKKRQYIQRIRKDNLELERRNGKLAYQLNLAEAKIAELGSKVRKLEGMSSYCPLCGNVRCVTTSNSDYHDQVKMVSAHSQHHENDESTCKQPSNSADREFSTLTSAITFD
jgi:hypothetical protein